MAKNQTQKAGIKLPLICNRFHNILFLLFLLDFRFFICLSKNAKKSKLIMRQSQNPRNRVTESHGSLRDESHRPKGDSRVALGKR